MIHKSKNKTIKKKCEKFCKKDYMIEMDKVFKHNSKKYKLPVQSPTKKDKTIMYKTCKKTYCNPTCDGYDFFGNQQLEFKKKIKNGFQRTISKHKINMLKRRGAMSSCVHITDYNMFHK
jgi:hypothetical protein